MKKVLQICGRAPGANLVPPDLPNSERWIIGSAYHEHVGTNYHRVFDVHPLEKTEHHVGILNQRPDAWAWYGQQDKPVYLIAPHPDVPTSLAYPNEALRTMGQRAYDAQSSTVDHMMGLALLENQWSAIHLCGIRLISLEEWVTQRECLAYWIGRCDERGIELVTDPVAALCTPEVRYGFGEKTGARRAPGQPVIVQGVPMDSMVLVEPTNTRMELCPR